MNGLKNCGFAVWCLLVLVSCSDELDGRLVEPKDLVGMYVPYEIEKQGFVAVRPTVLWGSEFQFYNSGVRFRKYGGYDPVSWQDSNDYDIYTDLGGKFSITQDNILQLRKAEWDKDYQILKYVPDTLWLEINGGTYKYKKELE